jgi:hypothetical protein
MTGGNSAHRILSLGYPTEIDIEANDFIYAKV